jgi:hypothetical protein
MKPLHEGSSETANIKKSICTDDRAVMPCFFRLEQGQGQENGKQREIPGKTA